MNVTAQMEAMKVQPLGVPLVSTNMSAPNIEDSLIQILIVLLHKLMSQII